MVNKINSNPMDSVPKGVEVYQRDSSKYQRIVLRWNEGKKDPKRHEIHFTVNTKTGDIYIDCRRRKIVVKHIAHVFVRPIHTLIKTLWHMSLIGPLVHEIKRQKSEEGFNKIDKKLLGKNMVRSFADIFRTPAYGIAMTAVSIAAILYAPIRPNSLYRTRAAVGKLERRLLRVDKISESKSIILTNCFNPWENVSRLDNYKPEKRNHNLAASRVKAMRIFREPFRCFRKLKKNETYVSSAKPKKRMCSP